MSQYNGATSETINRKEQNMIKETHEEKEKEIQHTRKSTDEELKKIETEIKREAHDKLCVHFNEKYENEKRKNNQIQLDKLNREKRLLSNEPNQRKKRNEVQQAVERELLKTAKKQEEIAEKKKNTDQEHRKEIAAMENQKVTAIIESKKEVAQKEAEYYRIQNRETDNMMKATIESLSKSIEMEQQRSELHKNKAFNSKLEEIRTSVDDAQRAYNKCQTFFQITTWNHSEMLKAKNKFEDLKDYLFSLQRKLRRAQELLKDIDDERVSQLQQKLQYMNSLLFELTSCVSMFIGRFENGNTTRNDEDEKELKKLMKEMSEIHFDTLPTGTTLLFDNLSSNSSTFLKHHACEE